MLQLNSGSNAGKSCFPGQCFSPLRGGHTVKMTAHFVSHTQVEKVGTIIPPSFAEVHFKAPKYKIASIL